jgi:hypothetical protein
MIRLVRLSIDRPKAALPAWGGAALAITSPSKCSK